MEITANAIQTVATNQNVLFTDTVVPCGCSMIHREGSGLITVKGSCCNQSRARFRVFFSGNIATPTGVTPGVTDSIAISLNGEAVESSIMSITPGAVNQYFNVASAVFIEVPKGYNVTIAVKNSGDNAVNVQNANLIVERVA